MDRAGGVNWETGKEETVAVTQGEAASAAGPSVLDSVPHSQSRVVPASPRCVWEVSSVVASISFHCAQGQNDLVQEVPLSLVTWPYFAAGNHPHW